MRASLKNRVEIIETIKALEFRMSRDVENLNRLIEINRKDFWTKRDVELLKKHNIFLKAKLRAQRKKNE